MSRTFNWKIVFRSTGALILIESFFLMVSTAVALLYHESDLLAFVISILISSGVGILFLLLGRRAEGRIAQREGYFIVVIVWLLYSLFGMLPFLLSGAIPDFTDAFFEAMSGFTTTGTTILPDIEALPHACLFWRALTQWIGGAGIIVLSIAILPIFGQGGMMLYSAESSGISYEKPTPRIAEVARMIWSFYLIISLTETLLLRMFGMSWFDAVCHSLATVSTGGFSTKNLSVGAFSSAGIHYTITFFTFISGLNFSLLIYAFRGQPSRLFHDEEARWYTSATLLSSLLLAVGIFLMFFTHLEAGFYSDKVYEISSFKEAFRAAEMSFRGALFEVVSTMTSCGFAISDYTRWQPFMWSIMMAIMLTGGCAGSTSGGFKWIRIIILFKLGKNALRHAVHPNQVLPIRINGKIVSLEQINSIFAFMMWYYAIIVLATLSFCALGVDLMESLSTAASAIANIGPALGIYGPSGSYAGFPVIGKWIYVALMLIGRLEIITVLLLLTPSFWKK